MQKLSTVILLLVLLSCKKDKSFLAENNYHLLLGKWERGDEYIEFFENGKVKTNVLWNNTLVNQTGMIQYLKYNTLDTAYSEFIIAIKRKSNLTNEIYIKKNNYDNFSIEDIVRIYIYQYNQELKIYFYPLSYISSNYIYIQQHLMFIKN